MKIFYDQKVDAAYLQLSEETSTGVIEVDEGVNLDIAEDGKIENPEAFQIFKRKNDIIPLK